MGKIRKGGRMNQSLAPWFGFNFIFGLRRIRMNSNCRSFDAHVVDTIDMVDGNDRGDQNK